METQTQRSQSEAFVEDKDYLYSVLIWERGNTRCRTRELRRARAKKATAKVEELRPYVEGVAKNLVDKLTAPRGSRGASR